VALAARLVGTSATIFMASDAAVPKVQATRGHGAEIVFYDRQTEDIDPHVLVDILRAS
jgi:threonine dehydratase